jgi:hypothetical protein
MLREINRQVEQFSDSQGFNEIHAANSGSDRAIAESLHPSMTRFLEHFFECIADKAYCPAALSIANIYKYRRIESRPPLQHRLLRIAFRLSYLLVSTKYGWVGAML